MRGAGCFPVVVGFGATGEYGEVVGSVGSGVEYIAHIFRSSPCLIRWLEVKRGEGVDVGSAGKVGCKREEAGSVSASRWEDRERNQASLVCILPMGLRPLPPIGNLGGGGIGMRRVFDQELEAEVDGQDAH